LTNFLFLDTIALGRSTPSLENKEEIVMNWMDKLQLNEKERAMVARCNEIVNREGTCGNSLTQNDKEFMSSISYRRIFGTGVDGKDETYYELFGHIEL
jgi:hypothetical protein